MRFYVACLASYNNGTLHGAWVDADSDVETMQSEIAAMLRDSPFPNVTVNCPDCDDCPTERETCETCRHMGNVPSAEEYAVHDYEDMPTSLGEYPSLEDIAAIFELFETGESDHGLDAEHVKAIIDDQGGNLVYAKERFDHVIGVYPSFREYSDELADDMIACHSAGKEVPQELINYFDYDSYARDMSHAHNVLDVSDGVLILSE